MSGVPACLGSNQIPEVVSDRCVVSQAVLPGGRIGVGAENAAGSLRWSGA